MVTGFVRSCEAVGRTSQASLTAPSHTNDSGRHHNQRTAGAHEMGIGPSGDRSCASSCRLFCRWLTFFVTATRRRMRGVSTNYEGTTDPYSRHPSGRRKRYLLCNQKVNGLLCPSVVTDFVARVHYVSFSFGDVTVIDIRRLYLSQTDFWHRQAFRHSA
jgi:hypothetical protein